MHFVKWVRKNNRKIMVFVVIFSMLSFVIGYTGIQIFFSLFGGGNPVLGTFEDGQEVRAKEFMVANKELSLLRDMGADRILLSQGNQGLAGPLMSYLLFPDSMFVGDMPAQLKQAATTGQISVSSEQIEDFFSERAQPEVIWILLRAEAEKAGYAASDTVSRTLLRQILPQLANGLDASQMINTIIARHNTSEDQLVRTFADLLGVMFYTGAVLDSQAVTLNQVQAAIGRTGEKYTAEFVRIPAEWFTETVSPPTEAELIAKFDAYKDVLPGQLTDENPYGTGYKLPKRVQLEYMAIMLDDIEKLIEKPTAESMEEYYSQHLNRFTTEEPVDPNNPEGEKISKTRSFAEAMPQIRQILEQERILRMANQLFNDARSMTEKGLAALDMEKADLAHVQAASGDYTQAATSLSGQYKATVISGKTGWLSTGDFAKDNILRGLRLQQGTTATPLSEIVFAVQPDLKKTNRKIGVPIMRLWENIGPMTGGYYSEQEAKYHRLMTMVRVVAIEDETVPDTMDITYSTNGMVISPAQQQDESETTFSLAKQVADDVRRDKAMESAKTRAETLSAMVKELGWDKAREAFSKQYPIPRTGDPNTYVEGVMQQLRMSAAEIEASQKRIASNPYSAEYIKNRIKNGILINQLCTLLPPDAQTTGIIFDAMEIKPLQAWYVVKQITRTPASEKDYLDNKVMTSLRLSTETIADLALTQLNVKNLFARMGYKAEQMPVIPEEVPVDLPAPGEGL